jgi:hypothetical protein
MAMPLPAGSGEPGELKRLIDEALENDSIYQGLLRQMRKYQPGTPQLVQVARMKNGRKAIIENRVKAQHPNARKKGGMVHSLVGKQGCSKKFM